MEKAILKAKKGGFKTKYLSEYSDTLNPEFWKCLGRTEEWTDMLNPPFTVPINLSPQWRYQWHRFIDHLAEGKSVDSFFESLLSKGVVVNV